MNVAGTDSRLVARALAGETGAFEELVRCHLRSAHAVALGVLANPADAEDVCQDAFLTALEKLEECREPDRFAGWLLRIVRNRALDLLESRARREGEPLERVAETASADDPGRDAERSELRERLLSALGGLPQTQREVVLLHDLEGWRHREIAELLGTSEGAVRVRLHEARRRLRAALERNPGGEDPVGKGG
jgi:RNA polymerase sigma-70 factor, ECF subfamily